MPQSIVTVRIDGLDKLQDMLERQPLKNAKNTIRTALTVASKIMEDGMIKEAPVYTGNDPRIPPGFLAEHINTHISVRNNLSGSATIGPQARIDYPLAPTSKKAKLRKKGSKVAGRIAVLTVARFLEYGTSKMKANPFITRSWETYKNACLVAIVNTLQQLVPKGF
jgi:HK97 gp10 family phage protein